VKKAKMSYEFDAGDVLQSTLYPAMARTFRTAGFQWATQFAYDPMATAWNNTEYQTHYLNLAYTPSKAISLMIASRVFQRVARNHSFGTYPEDTLFDVFRLSYALDLSEMNSEREFYYSNTTETLPKKPEALEHIAGVGNSPLVEYDGNGAYFIDKVSEGLYRLEVMPDVIQLTDPFGRASPEREVRRVLWRNHRMSIALQGLDEGFYITSASGKKENVKGKEFDLTPGVYYLTKKKSGFRNWSKKRKEPLFEFYAPAAPKVINGNADNQKAVPVKSVKIKADADSVLLFHPAEDLSRVLYYNPDWRKHDIRFRNDSGARLRSWLVKEAEEEFLGWQAFIGDKMSASGNRMNQLLIRVQAAEATEFEVTLVGRTAEAFTAKVAAGAGLQFISIPLDQFQRDSFLLLPRPYPSYLPLWFRDKGSKALMAQEVERLEIRLGKGLATRKTYGVDILGVWLIKK
jgi:hypothetical protein